jgi:hypothetical protein
VIKVQDYWIIDIVIKIIQKPLEIEKTCLHLKEPIVAIKEELQNICEKILLVDS